MRTVAELPGFEECDGQLWQNLEVAATRYCGRTVRKHIDHPEIMAAVAVTTVVAACRLIAAAKRARPDLDLSPVEAALLAYASAAMRDEDEPQLDRLA